ncbi:MAG TPA: DUF4030 domain-containing protein [Pseudoneobacillus sp.]|nr:DUF4030 domain-containing protein [Pseudoneobacillus sp.]
MKNKMSYPDLKEIRFEEKHKQNVLKEVRKRSKIIELKVKPKNRGRKRIVYSTIIAVTLFTIVILSSNLSVGVAKVTAKIPYLSLFIKQEEYKYAVINLISQTIVENQYDPANLDISVPKREIKLALYGSEKEVKGLKNEVSENLNEALVANNFGKYKIRVSAEKDNREPYVVSPEEEKYMQQMSELESKINDWLKQNNYESPFPTQVQINKVQNSIYVAIPKTESKERVAALKEKLAALSKPYGESFKYRVSRIDMAAREQELRWGELGIVDIIGRGLMENKQFKVKTYSYSFHPLPLQLIIKTTVDSNDSDVKEVVEKIEKEIKYFMETDQRTKTVRNDPYEIIIMSKDKKKIN